MGHKVHPQVKSAFGRQAIVGAVGGVVAAMAWRVYYKNVLLKQTAPQWNAAAANAVVGLQTPKEFFATAEFLNDE
jgi:hypothetical protein